VPFSAFIFDLFRWLLSVSLILHHNKSIDQACLSEEILAGESTAVQQLLFARLAPLLLLKTVPAQSWLHDGSKDQKIWKQDFHQLLVSKIASEVTQRAMQLYEFDEVRCSQMTTFVNYWLQAVCLISTTKFVQERSLQLAF